jgi:hypothetical protein
MNHSWVPVPRTWCFWVAALLVTGATQAQVENSREKSIAAASQLNFRSALADYQPYKDQPVQPWRETNDEVGRIGGWRAYAKEAAQSAVPGEKPAPETSPAAPRATDPHADHHGSQP